MSGTRYSRTHVNTHAQRDGQPESITPPTASRMDSRHHLSYAHVYFNWTVRSVVGDLESSCNANARIGKHVFTTRIQHSTVGYVVVVVVVVSAKSAWNIASPSNDLDQQLVLESRCGNVVVAAELMGPLGSRTYSMCCEQGLTAVPNLNPCPY